MTSTAIVDVAPLLGAAGYRVIVPYLRGYGTTHFLSSETVRNGQQSVIAVDIIALLDELKIEQAILAGCDWGARTANIIAALWPERTKALVSVSGYLIGSREANRMPLPPKAELAMVVPVLLCDETRPSSATAKTGTILRSSFGSSLRRSGTSTMPRSIARAASFDNPDHVAIVIHNYRWRLEPRRRRATIRRSGKAARRRPSHRRAHHHPGR